MTRHLNVVRFVIISLIFSVSAMNRQALAAQPHADSVVGPVKCAECHKVEAKIWEGTHHFSTFTNLPRNDKAREVADKMGIKRIKAESLCLSCHFTTQMHEGREKAIAGISCESCHSGASAWVKRHGEYSGHEKKEDESAAERQQRWRDAEVAGMIRPNNIYKLAKNCYSCHVVPEEKLVNTGGHPAGSPFELVTWSQGEVRHNTWHNANQENRRADPNRRRLLYVIGTAVELEVSLMAVASATAKDRYAVSMAKRAQAAKLRMKKIAEALVVPEISAIVAAADGAALKLNNAEALTEASRQVGEQTAKLARSADGSGWGAVDSLIPGDEAIKGSPVVVPSSGGSTP
jgi:Zn finger protein HypA/HybF involved in hydrogenase expression